MLDSAVRSNHNSVAPLLTWLILPLSQVEAVCLQSLYRDFDKGWIFRGHFISPSVHRLYPESVSRIVSHWEHAVSDKHIILIASRRYYLMLPSTQVTAGGQRVCVCYADMENVTLNAEHLCWQMTRSKGTQGGANWVKNLPTSKMVSETAQWLMERANLLNTTWN